MEIKKEKLAGAARQFLKSGHSGEIEISILAAECDRIVRLETEKSSARAIQLGRKFVKRAIPHGGIVLQTAYRALGWASLVGGKFPQAEQSYLKARKMVKRDAMLRARIDRILTDVYMYLGNFNEARRRARLSLATFEKLKATDEMAKTRVNLANLLHRQDRHREAQQLYHEAAEFFETRGDRLLTAFCYHNEANTHVQLFSFDKAEALYRKAEKIFNKQGYDLRANGCRYGLAWLYMLEADYHRALKELADCEANYQKASQPREVVLCRLDRAEAYLGLNLIVDAKRAAQAAEKLAEKLEIRYESAKAALFLAKAYLAMGRIADARQAIKRAKEGFTREKNSAFLAVVELLSAQLNRNRAVRPIQITNARKRFSKAQLPLWEAICDLQILSQRPDDSRALRRLSRNPAVDVVPHLYARWQTIQGDRYAKRGQLASAIGYWNHACEVLDAVRAKLPPVDMRTAFLGGQGNPYCRLIKGELKRNPVTAAAWSERYKTAGLWQTNDDTLNDSPVRKEVEKSLSDLANRVTILSAGIEGTGKRRVGISPQAAEAFQDLQEKVRHDLASLETIPDARVERIEETIAQIHAAARRMPIVQFHAGGSDLIAFVHFRHYTHFYRYIDGARIAREFMSRWRFLIERASFSANSHQSSDLEDERQILKQIGEWLFSPLEISPEHRRLLILPEGDLINLPWQAVIHHGEPLAVNHEIVLSPSLRHHLRARDRQTRSKRIEVFVGVTDGLAMGTKDFEVLLLEEFENVTVHRNCRRNDWPDESQARLWHYTGHAQLRRDNPFYSSLLLSDGPLFAADFRLKHNIVDLVTLAACRTGQQISLPGEESTGLVRSLLEMGARSVLASHWAVSDDSTYLWMNEFYKRFLSGESVSSAARKTALKIKDKYPAAYHWAAFSVFGGA
jgi:tetratricopeptide (TPR) repeat protein